MRVINTYLKMSAIIALLSCSQSEMETAQFSSSNEGEDPLAGEQDALEPSQKMGENHSSNSEGFGSGDLNSPNPNNSENGTSSQLPSLSSEEGQAIVAGRCGDPSNVKTMTKTIFWKANDGQCPFGIGTNNPGVNERFSARLEEKKALELDENNAVCDISMNFPGDQIAFDDEFILTFNGIVLVASEDVTTSRVWNGLQTASFDSIDNELFIYDWSRIVGKPFPYDENEPYCLGGMNNCTLPKPNDDNSNNTGSMSLEVDKDLVQKVFNLSKERYFNLVVMGDNDTAAPGDCYHSDLSIEVEIEYIPY